MKLKKFLTIKKNGSVRITANKPSLDVDEITMQLNLDVPDALFEKPTLVADISVDENMTFNDVVPTEVIDNAKEILSNTLGMNLKLTVSGDEVAELLKK